MNVTKRDGSIVEVDYNKIKNRIKPLAFGLNVDHELIVRKVIAGIYDNIKTSELDELAVSVASSMIPDDYDYNILATRIAISNHHKKTSSSFTETMELLYRNGRISSNFYQFITNNKIKLRQTIKYSRDYNLDIFGFKTLERSYLMKIKKENNNKLEFEIVERPQDMFMRVAIQIHINNTNAMDKVIQTYDLMSNKFMIHASPTLFNSGTTAAQLSSCFLLHIPDSVEGLYATVAECAHTSKYSGGIGTHIQDVRSTGSFIQGNGGTSNGLVPYMKVLNETARHINQGSKRNGSIAVYNEPWHADIISFINTKKPQGPEETTCRDLFLALYINDIFMRRVRDNEMWSLMNPQICVGLTDAYGEEFDKLYIKYESEGKYVSQMRAIDLWSIIIISQIESGTPYIVYKDACNRLSNQNNLGCIKSSNLCSEILQYSDENETAVCNLASVGLPMFVVPVNEDLSNNIKPDIDLETYAENNIQTYFKLLNNTPTQKDIKYKFDFDKLVQVVRVLVDNLNQIIDNNFYINDKTRNSNFKHRPMGIGIQGLADVFIKLGYTFDSFEARLLNKQISEHMYYAALTESNKLAEINGTYSSYNTSRTRKGKLNYDVWNESCGFMDYNSSTDTWKFNMSKYMKIFPTNTLDESQLKQLYENDESLNWKELKEKINQYGLYNSLMLALMPTAGTSQILGFTESFEAITSNIYTRKTLAGTFIVINKHLVKDLKSLNLWNTSIKNQIINNDGSIQNLSTIPLHIQSLYKTVWEINQRHIINMSSDRTKYICQSQSLNIFLDDSSPTKVSNMLMYGWKSGLKTGLYYLRTQIKSKPTKFTQEVKKYTCTDEVCTSCSS